MSGTTSATTVIVADRNLRIVRVNDVLVNTGGLDGTQTEGLDSLWLLENIDLITADEADAICKTILEDRRFPGGARSYKKVITASEITGERWVILLGPHTDARGDVDGIIYAKFRSTVSDAAVKRELEPEKYYEYLVERSSDLVFLADEHGLITFANQAVEQFTGVPSSAVVGKHFSEMVHPDDVEYCRAAYDMVGGLSNPLPEFQCRVTAIDGSVRHVLAKASIVDTSSGRRVLAICRDVTESMELREKLLARNSALSALNRIVVALASCRTLDEGLQIALEKTLSALGLQKGSISLVEADGEPRMRVFTGFGSEMNLRGVICPITRLYRNAGEIGTVSDIASDDRFNEDIKAQLIAAGIEAAVQVPLSRGGSVKAILSLVVPPPAEMLMEQIEFLNLMVGILGPAIENARLHTDLADRVSLLAMLEKLAKSINAGRDLNTVIGACLEEVAAVVEFDQALLVFADADGKADVFSYMVGDEHASREPLRVAAGQLSMMEGLAHAQVLSDMSDEPTPHENVPLQGSAVVVPLRRDDRTFGILKVIHSKPHKFGEREARLIEAVAEHLAIAALNARLYEIEQTKSLELEALAREAHHRIKNNLQMITGLLSISGDEPASAGTTAVARCQRQIQAIATVHDLLTPRNRKAKLELRECLGRVAGQALAGLGCNDVIALSVTGDECVSTPDCAAALGIIVNELVCNAVEHGFPDGRCGQIEICVRSADGRRCVTVSDNGVGLPEDFQIPESPDCGLGLVKSLASYGLGGTFEFGSRSEGTKAVVQFY